MTQLLKKDTAATVSIQTVSTTDGNTAVTTATPTITLLNIARSGTSDSAYTAATNSPTHISGGVWEIDLTAAEIDTEGELWVKGEATGCAVYRTKYQVLDDFSSLFDADSLQVDLSQTTLNKAADATLRRNTDDVEGSSDGNALALESLNGSVSKSVHKVDTSASTVTVYQSNGTSTLGTLTVTTSQSAYQITAQS